MENNETERRLNATGRQATVPKQACTGVEKSSASNYLFKGLTRCLDQIGFKQTFFHTSMDFRRCQ